MTWKLSTEFSTVRGGNVCKSVTVNAFNAKAQRRKGAKKQKLREIKMQKRKSEWSLETTLFIRFAFLCVSATPRLGG